MIEFGKTLRTAREAKGLTPGQIAERTHMMIQVVEGLENENFSKIVAPIYGRGFVKLYCEAVGLEPKPLVDAFMEIYGGRGTSAARSTPDGDIRRARHICREEHASSGRAFCAEACACHGGADRTSDTRCTRAPEERPVNHRFRYARKARRTRETHRARTGADSFALCGADAGRRRVLDANRQLAHGRSRRRSRCDSIDCDSRRPRAIPRDNDSSRG